jgi:hypothetical protein
LARDVMFSEGVDSVLLVFGLRIFTTAATNMTISIKIMTIRPIVQSILGYARSSVMV